MSGWWWLPFAIQLGCSVVPNPLYCDENSDCRNGTVCNLETNGCETVGSIDAGEDVASDGPSSSWTVQEIRATSTPADALVELTGVLVTAVDQYGSRTGDFWVQEPGGGQHSGIHVYGAIASEVALLGVGDIVDIGNARKVLYTPPSDTSGRVEIEIAPRFGGNLIVSKTGIGTVALTDVNVASIASLMQPQLDEEREKWAGTLVRVQQVRAEGPPTLDTSALRFAIGPFDINDTQVELPAGVVAGTCFDEIIGIVEYFRSYNIVPRGPGDLSIGSTCP